jgi:hypothetical protein
MLVMHRLKHAQNNRVLQTRQHWHDELGPIFVSSVHAEGVSHHREEQQEHNHLAEREVFAQASS